MIETFTSNLKMRRTVLLVQYLKLRPALRENWLACWVRSEVLRAGTMLIALRVNSTRNRMLITDQVATAPCLDPRIISDLLRQSLY